jgi:phage baseplate assembly protein W
MAVQRADDKSNLREKEIYSDFFTNFNIHPNTGTLLKRTNVEAVKRSLRNLLSTDKGERLFSPDFGANIKQYLFEPADSVTRENLKVSISEAIKNYEPRAYVDAINISLSNDEHTYTIDIIFKVINNPDPALLQVKLDRVR